MIKVILNQPLNLLLEHDVSEIGTDLSKSCCRFAELITQ